MPRFAALFDGPYKAKIVTDAQGRFSWSFQIAPDGSLMNGEPFYRLEMPETGWMSGVQGVAEDSIGQVYFATAVGVQVCEANGRVAQILNPPEYGGVSNLAFAGSYHGWGFHEDGCASGVRAAAEPRLPGLRPTRRGARLHARVGVRLTRAVRRRVGGARAGGRRYGAHRPGDRRHCPVQQTPAGHGLGDRHGRRAGTRARCRSRCWTWRIPPTISCPSFP